MSAHGCKNKEHKKKCIKQCSKEDYKAAAKVTEGISAAINLTSTNPKKSAKKFASYFARGGVFSSSYNPIDNEFLLTPANVYGRSNVYENSLAYATSGVETDQHVEPRLLIWDCLNRTMVVEKGWQATLNEPRVFGYGFNDENQPVPTIVLPAGATYQQDDAVVFRFNDDQLVYYREYFDTTQFVSTYTTDYPKVCKNKCPKPCASINPCTIQPCTENDRARAIEVFDSISYALNLLSYDEQLSADLFTSLFAKEGVWSVSISPSTYPYTDVPQANFKGHQQVKDFYLSYALNPGETDQKVTTRRVYWDCNNRTLAVERLWEAKLTAPRIFGYANTPGGNPPTVLGVGDTYQQDDLVVVRFDCNYKVLFYREYFDLWQYQTTYTEFVPPVDTNSCKTINTCEQCK